MLEIVFVSMTLIISWILSFIFIPKGAIGATVIIIMIPAILGFIIKIIKYRSIKEVFKPLLHRISIKGIMFSFVFPIIIISLCSILALITGVGSVDNYDGSISQILIIIVMSVPFSIVTLGEEYGWRGYLLGEWEKTYGLKKSNILVGIVWILYHLPTLYMMNLSYGIFAALIFTIVQSICIFCVNFSYTYLYTLSKNVLLASMMHSAWNNINTFILGDTYRNEATGLIDGNVKVINGEGIFGMIFLIISAFIFYKVLFGKSK